MAAQFSTAKKLLLVHNVYMSLVLYSCRRMLWVFEDITFFICFNYTFTKKYLKRKLSIFLWQTSHPIQSSHRNDHNAINIISGVATISANNILSLQRSQHEEYDADTVIIVVATISSNNIPSSLASMTTTMTSPSSALSLLFLTTIYFSNSFLYHIM